MVVAMVERPWEASHFYALNHQITKGYHQGQGYVAGRVHLEALEALPSHCSGTEWNGAAPKAHK